ncbi:MerR family transcriptional regulator [Levilactobacillus zymae]|uniref:MerR family transcriptional regulator n=1 Tax=Levilactobacillus zymae TaxID=267363 RepID=A0ABQ0X428_9LACO|nr:MerR family transcriptional regulator [Levilactobacillus zymae]KRL06887.1 transcription regulator [Levilactobacillus zymae DSM 19395]QFR61722.1 MerR family transcriptional regulator [Levilactobacillus zymae]GEO72258.1 MerR family transcriptional regulator [Levilactobacillus zymae]
MSYSIGQVAEKTGLSCYTLRYYDREGLMPFVHRNAAGRREFSEADLDLVDLITCLKSTGMALKEIRHFIELSMAGDASLAERLQIYQQQRAGVDQQIAQLQAYRQKLNYKVRYFEAACEAGTEAAVEGTCDLPETVTINDALRVKPAQRRSSAS